MAGQLALVNDDEDGEGTDAPEPKKDSRDRELCRLKLIREQLVGGEDGSGLYADIEAGYVAQADRSNDIMDNWDAYKCKIGGGQYYNGNSKIFFPIMANAIRARMTRFANQAFPQSGRYIDATTANGDEPFAQIALMEHYIKALRLKNTIVKPLLKNGDLEGNYTIYVDWKSRKRKVMSRGFKPVMDGGEERPEYGEVEDIQTEEVDDDGPDVEVLSDSDVLIMPVTSKTIEDALAVGGAVCVRRRFTKRAIKSMIKDGDIDKKAGEAFLETMSNMDDKPGRRDTAKQVGEAAGIRVHKGVKTGIVCEVWTRLELPGGERELTRSYWGGDDHILGCKRNPYWNDRCPVITEPLDRDSTSIKGRPPVADCMDIQIAANDMVNESVDVSNFAAMPIVAADPEKNPQSATMVLGLGAVWDVDPNAVKFLEFPALYEKLLPFIDKLEQTIFQTLGVNPSMLPNSTGKPGAKRNQAEVAMEQQIDMLTTADAASVLEDVLNQMLMRFIDYDHQFRSRPTTVRAFGPMGLRANMEDIPPTQAGTRYDFQWLGVESARNAAMAQQQIAAMATLMKIPPQAIPGYKIDLSAAVQQIALTQFGARIAPLILISLKDQQSVPSAQENEMLAEGFQVTVHPMDDDVAHLQAHMVGFKQAGGHDPQGVWSLHIAGHNQQRQAKAIAAQQQGGGAQAPPGGGRGTQPGAQPQGPRPPVRVPGAINQDRMAAAGAPGQPRKT